MFLNGSYFQGALALPQCRRNLKSTVEGSVGAMLTETVGELSLEWLIARYEEEFLCRLLGLSLYEAWIEGLAAPEPAQIWLDLKGRIFKTTAGASLSPAANYVYFHGMGLSASQTMMTGEKRQKGSFSDNVSVVRKQVTAWNDMIDAVSHIREWVFVHRKDLASEMPQTEHFHWREWCGHHFSPINELGL